MSDFLTASPSSVDARTWNLALLNKIQQPGGTEKVAGLFTKDIVLTRLNESGLARKILATKTITPDQLDFDITAPDVPTKFEPIENPLDTNLISTTDALGPTEDFWFQGKFFKIRFKTHISKKFKMTEQQMVATKYPIKQYIDAQVRNDFLANEDHDLINAFENCIQVSGQKTSYTGTVSGLFQKEHIMKLLKMGPRQRMVFDRLVINEETFYDILNWNQSEVGSVVTADIIENGVMGEDLKFKSYFGLKWLITNNADIVKPKTIYALAPQRFMGVSYELFAPETYVEFKDLVFSCYSRYVRGSAIMNINSVAKMVIT
jgi:hypothetical protein